MLLLLASAAAGVAFAANNRPEQAGRSELKLRAGRFDPRSESAAAAIASLPAWVRSLDAKDDLVLIQFQSEPEPAWIEVLAAEGVTFFGYVPENAYLARLASPARGPTAARSFVRAVVPYLPSLRVAPELLRQPLELEDKVLHLLITATPDTAPSALRLAISKVVPRDSGIDTSRHPRATLADLEVEPTDLAGLLSDLASIPDVVWIEERLPVTTCNSEMKPILQTGGAGGTRIFDEGLTGSGQILAVADSGLDTQHCFFTDSTSSVTFELVDPSTPPTVPAVSPDHRKILAYQYHAGSNTSDNDGHGTHVVGTAVGDDFATPASGTDPGLDPFDGNAPGAKVVFQDIQGGGGNFLDLPSNLYGYVQSAYNAGARVHSDSWSSATNTYTSFSSQVDDFSWDNPEMLFVFAAGNSGPNASTIHAPAAAKNVISVGMVENPAGGDANNLDSGSSNGPTSDGRRKPELVNVGGFPTRSAQEGTVCGLTDFGGTSMATPGVAGAATLVRQYYMEGFYPYGYFGSGPALTPSAVLLKATLVNSAVNIGGDNVDAPIPDNSQGWGRVLLDDALAFVGDDRSLLILHDDDVSSSSDGFSVGATVADSYSVSTCGASIPLKATLVWNDPPVGQTSGQAWVNNLDLEVVAPDATVYRGNVFSNGVSTTGGTADDRNNVEQVLLPGGTVQSGTYTVRVVPTTVAVGLQPYALIVTGDVSPTPAPRLAIADPTVSGGCDGDSFLDEGETISVSYDLSNVGCGDATSLTASLATSTSEPLSISPTEIPVGTVGTSGSTLVTFDIQLGDTGGVCGGEALLALTVEDVDGRRWKQSDLLSLRFDPATGSRTELDDVESGDTSAASDPEWQINTCQASSGANAWHMGQSDCTGIPRDASSQSIEFERAIPAGEVLITVSFVHSFDGYSNSNFADSVHFEVDHDLDGNFDTVASWDDAGAPKSMTSSGTLDLSGFQLGAAASAWFRFRFQSGANWVGGPNNASGWNVDDFRVDFDRFAECDSGTFGPPDDVGNSLLLTDSGTDAVLSWEAVVNASSYRVLRSASPDFGSFIEFSTTTPSLSDMDVPPKSGVFFYDVRSVNPCGISSDD